jgi:hypothetical protein
MDKKCLTCLINAPKKDSLISNYSLQLVNFQKINRHQNIILKDNAESISSLTDENQKINLHLTQARRNVKICGVGGFVVGVIAVLLLK